MSVMGNLLLTMVVAMPAACILYIAYRRPRRRRDRIVTMVGLYAMYLVAFFIEGEVSRGLIVSIAGVVPAAIVRSVPPRDK